MEKYLIKIDKNSRNEIVIEKVVKTGDEFNEENFFYEEYSKADTIIKSIIPSYQNFNGNYGNNYFEGTVKNDKFSGSFYRNQNENCRKTKDNNDNSNPPKSNIITFSGNRGTGKTSAMVSFGKYLESQKEFKVLEMIDPSHFEKNESILLNVITLLFKNVKKHLKNNKTLSPPTELLKAFEKVFKSVKKMDENIPTESTLEYLSQLSDSLDLKESINKLIKKTLDFFSEKTDTENDAKFEYLVLMIDDLDMNVSFAPKMLEQIRKFLIQKNLIILIATNIDQLQLEMQESYSGYFAKTYNAISKPSDVCVDIEDMATKYLLKLFPPLQRIHIGNTANKLINTNITIIDGKNDNGNDKELYPKNDLQKLILTSIWKKTRLIFIPRKDNLHPIIPTNLRALNQFINTLIDMDDVGVTENENKMFAGKDEYGAVKVNFYKFKDYIMNVWIPSNVSFEGQKVFDNIPQELARINKHLIQSINVIGAQYKKRLLVKETKEERKEKDFDADIYTFVSRNDPRFLMANRMSDIINFPSNNSMGDVLLLLDKYKTYFESENENNFIESVKIYYSMLLFETMFFDEGSKFPLANDSKNISNIQKLIGGTIYFPHYFEIIKDKHYSKGVADMKKTYKIIKYIKIDEWEKLKGKKIETKIEKINDFLKVKGVPDSQITKLGISGTLDNLILKYKKDYEKYLKGGEDVAEHLFYHQVGPIKCNVENKENNIFTIHYYGKSRPDRSYDTHIYDTTKEKEKEIEEAEEVFYYRFDILSLLVNILNPSHTLYRFSGNEDKKYDGWLCNIEKNEKKENISVTNILLPIYSVDLVLSYLRESYYLNDLVKKSDIDKKLDTQEKEVLMRKQTMIACYYTELLELSKEKLNRIDTDIDPNIEGSIFKRYKNIYNNSAKIFGIISDKPIRIRKIKKQKTRNSKGKK